jgi:Alkylmercury lyase
MVRGTGRRLNKWSAAAALSRPAREVHLAVLAAFAQTGQGPDRGELERVARAHGADPAATLAELVEQDVLAFGSDGALRAAYPFSPAPTSIQVTWAGGPVTHAMCAVDALGMSAMLGRPVTITAAEPGTGRAITVRADHGRAQWDPAGAVVFAGSTGEQGCPSVDRTCGYISFFTSAAAAHAWAARHPAVTGSVLSQAQALRQGVAEFGDFMRAQHPRRRWPGVARAAKPR